MIKGGLMRSERRHGLSTEQFSVSAYLKSSRNLKDLKDGGTGGVGPLEALSEGSKLDERLGAAESSQSLAFEVLHTRVVSFGTA